MATTPFSVPWLSGMPTYKIQVFFSQVAYRQGGWSCTFYVNTSASNLLAVVNGLQAIFDVVTVSGVQVPWVRASTIGSSRLATTYRFAQTSTTNTTVSTGPVVPGVKLLIALASGTGGYTKQWIGGMASNWLLNGSLNPNAPGISNMLALFNFLVQNNFVIRKISVQNKTTIQSITTAGLVTAPGHGLALNSQCYVRIGRMVDGAKANGIWVATPLTTSTIQLGPSQILPFTTTPVPTKTAYITQYGYAGFSIVSPGTLAPPAINTSVVGATTHRVGRPAYQYSGRRRIRSS